MELLPLLEKSENARIIFVSSGGMYADMWKEKKIGVYSMHPGWADTKVVRNSLSTFSMLTSAILRTPEEGADTIVYLAVSLYIELMYKR